MKKASNYSFHFFGHLITSYYIWESMTHRTWSGRLRDHARTESNPEMDHSISVCVCIGGLGGQLPKNIPAQLLQKK